MHEYVKEHTKEELKAFYKSHPFNTSGSTSLAKNPKFSPYKAGQLSEKSEKDGLNALNFVRYVARINSDVVINEQMAKYSQAASELLAKRNKGLSHYPERPDSVSDELYELGATGARSSNLARASWDMSLSYTVIEMYMDDGDSSNIDRVGHRRWCINPSMKETGFGFYRGYSALYAFDKSGENEVTAGYVPWPARMMPYEHFYGPWSVQLNKKNYRVSDEMEVTLTTSSGETMTFSEDDADGYFNVDTGGYGFGPAIIFEPDEKIGKNATVEVEITGLKRPDGTDVDAEWNPLASYETKWRTCKESMGDARRQMVYYGHKRIYAYRVD